MNPSQMYINGEWVNAVSGKTRTIINPATQHTIAEVAEGDRTDARAAIAAAREAFDQGEWKNTPATERGRLVYQLGELVQQHEEELASLETLDTGKTLEESRWDMSDIAGIFRYFGEMADKDGGEIISSPIPQTSSKIVREPVGVCGQISPWNYPLLQASWKMAPALAAGCSLIMKPSELTPLTTLKITELAAQLEFPRGVINTVLGAGAEVGAELAESHQVDLISFTGGITTGKRIMQAAAGNVKKVALELGGKNPNIIFADADLETAVDYILNGVFFHAGQICSAGTRVMLETSVHDQIVEQLLDRLTQIVIGHGQDPATQMGPLISAEHRAKVEQYIQIGKQEGAQLLFGGSRPAAPELQDGFFFEPTLFSECTNGMRIVQEEIFGPVLTIERFSSEEEVLCHANSTIYGLSAGFWTNDPGRMERMSAGLRFGTVWVNDFNVYFTQAPWGGYKQSGFGRELGRAGLEEYMEVKHVFQNHAPKPLYWFGH